MASEHKFEMIPMSQDDFERYLSWSAKTYSLELKTALGISLEDATAFGTKQVNDLLPQGLNTPENWLYSIRIGENQNAGILWITEMTFGSTKLLFLSEIFLEPQFRSQGFGRKIMEWTEATAMKMGHKKIWLNVFSHNNRAISFYESIGYTVTSQRMIKAI